MRTYSWIITLLIPVISNAQSKKTISSPKPVLITAEAGMFTNNPMWPDTTTGLVFHYQDATGLQNRLSFFPVGKTGSLPIQQPCFVAVNGDGTPYLLYPGEHISITMSADKSSLVFSSAGDKKRSLELEATKIFFDSTAAMSRKTVDLIFKTKPRSTQELLDLESDIIGINQFVCYRKHRLLDSLRQVKSIGEMVYSELYKQIYSDSLAAMINFYTGYEEQLTRYHLLNERIRQILKTINENELPTRGQWSPVESVYKYFERAGKTKPDTRGGEHERNRRIIDSCFSGQAKAFLWSNELHDAFLTNAPVSQEELILYKADPNNKKYEELISRKFSEKENLLKTTGKTVKNRLISMYMDWLTELESETTLDDVFSREDRHFRQKDDLFYISFWASSCVPCIEELRYTDTLRKTFQKDKIRFLPISFDRSFAGWIKTSDIEKINGWGSYLMAEGSNSAFAKEYKITELPRYMLFGKDGKIIDANAPAPSDPKLRDLIHLHLPPQ